ncbi:hypothetical protein [Burkholderia gladioli]|uniref:hypothetical protein n=1 Tax=Burkholderia gladioli TaxID=28095 RepID=UPI00163DFDDA|nr:hypothetical protein [Burkholderia gladioli]
MPSNIAYFLSCQRIGLVVASMLAVQGSLVYAQATDIAGSTANAAGSGAAFSGMPGNTAGPRFIQDTARSGENNSPSLDINSVESIDHKKTYATHYGILMNGHQLSDATGDRIAIGAVQLCDATVVGKSCVGSSGLAVAGGGAVGNYTGMNARALVPEKLKGPVGAAVGLEANIETHSPVKIRNGLRVADENQSGGEIEHGEIEDAAIAIVTDSPTGNPGFKLGIQFGEALQGFPQYWPIIADGTLLQAVNPTVRLRYGLDLSGSSAGFSKSAIALPKSVNGNGIVWGENGEGGRIESQANRGGGLIRFADDGIWLNRDRPLLNIGGVDGNTVVNHGSTVQYTLKGFVRCNGTDGPCTASPHIGFAGVSPEIRSGSMSAGSCVAAEAAIAGASNEMVVSVTPRQYPGDGFYWNGFVGRPGVVTVKLCATRAGIPLPSAYNIRVLP